MKATRIHILLSGILFFALFLAACSAAAPMEADIVMPEEPAGVIVAEESIAEAPSSGGPDAAPQEPVPGAPTSKDELSLLSLPGNQSRMIIKDGFIKLLVSDSSRAIDQVTEIVTIQGGYIISSRTWYQGDFQFAEIRLGVPSAVFETTMGSLRKISIRVLDETASGQDVSAEYNDLESRLTNLEATAERVRAFLNEAKTVEESLKINETLSELEAEIEQVKGQMKFYEGRAAYSTITVQIEPQIPTPTPEPTITPRPTATPVPWRPGEDIKEAAEVSVDLMQGAISALIWVVIVLGPFIVALVAFIWLLRRFVFKPKPKVKPQPPVEPPNPPAAVQ